MRIEAPTPDMGISPWIVAFLAPFALVFDNFSVVIYVFLAGLAAALGVLLLTSFFEARADRRKKC